MNRNIEEYIRKNRKAFEDAEPPEDIWHGIEVSLMEEEYSQRKQKTLMFRTLIAIAAMFLLICSAGLLLYKAKEASKQDYSSIDPVLANKQKQFSYVIDQKREALSAMATKNPQLYEEFSGVLRNMQQNYTQLKEEYAQSPNKEKTLQAMINNLQMQIQVLNQQLEILNYIQEEEKKTPYEQI